MSRICSSNMVKRSECYKDGPKQQTTPHCQEVGEQGIQSQQLLVADPAPAPAPSPASGENLESGPPLPAGGLGVCGWGGALLYSLQKRSDLGEP